MAWKSAERNPLVHILTPTQSPGQRPGARGSDEVTDCGEGCFLFEPRLALSSSRSRRPCVLNRHDHDTVGELFVHVDENHPAPGAQQETEALPPPGQLRIQQGESASGASDRRMRSRVSSGRLSTVTRRSMSSTAARASSSRGTFYSSSKPIVSAVAACRRPSCARSSAPSMPSSSLTMFTGSGSASRWRRTAGSERACPRSYGLCAPDEQASRHARHPGSRSRAAWRAP
jgi:hypothetical protein